MSQVPLEIEEITLGDSRITLFADFPWRLYRGDPCWTPPLRGDLLGNRLLGLVGLLTPQYPYHRYADVMLRRLSEGWSSRYNSSIRLAIASDSASSNSINLSSRSISS